MHAGVCYMCGHLLAWSGWMGMSVGASVMHAGVVLYMCVHASACMMGV